MTLNPTRSVTPYTCGELAMRRVGAWAVREGRRLSRFRPDNGKERVWGPSPRGRAGGFGNRRRDGDCGMCDVRSLSLSLRSAPFELLLLAKGPLYK